MTFDAQMQWDIIERMMVGDFNKYHDPDTGRFSSGGTNIESITKPTTKKLGRLNLDKLRQFYPNIRREDVVITEERIQHIKNRHPEDYELFEKYGSTTIEDPDLILRDSKNKHTVLMVKAIPKSNLEAVIKLSMVSDPDKNDNSVLSFHRIRNSSLEKLKNKNEVLYKRDKID